MKMESTKAGKGRARKDEHRAGKRRAQGKDEERDY